MSAESIRHDSKGRLWRSRWAAIGAAVAVTFGAGGLAAVNAAGGEDSTTVLTDPVRVLDSRDPLNVGLAGPFASQVSQKLQITGSIPTTSGTKTVVPTGATGVLLNVTAVAPTANGFVSIRPGDATGTPSTSSLNVSAGQIVPNAVMVALPTSGANAGKIEITYDAFGVPGPTTDILIDVVGHTSSSTLAALQTQIDTKANAADVYTKAEIDGRPFDHLIGGALISPAGSASRTFGDVTVAKTGTGLYEVTAPGVTETCNLTIQVTPLNVSSNATARFVSAGHQSSDPCRVRVHATNSAGVAVDSWFQFTLFQGGTGSMPLELGPCVEDPSQSCD